jgi:UDP-N-acetylglucosamine--N-acetylmuramyl-(pentapeptide) pyrophosphoryl-undecaprenol N-acetylglucosamine transferase
MRLMIAGGGTGGHLFPSIAIAEELRSREPSAEIIFVGTERGIEARVLPELGWALAVIEVSGLKTVGLRSAMRGFARVPGALLQSRRVIQSFRPDVVVGVGGYASGPVVLAARLMGIPTAILEQNSIPGLTNKILGKFVDAIFLAFAETRSFFAKKKIIMSGNPIRAAIRDALLAGPVSTDERPPHIFAFGGSQGAVALNALVADAVAILSASDFRLTILHQTGKADLDATKARYADAGISADCQAFIVDMAAEYRRADLVIARAGATTVAELTVVGTPAILVPYPYAADNHQEINARELVGAGAATMFRQADLDAETLADAIADTLDDRHALERMGSAMNALGRPHAAATIIDWCEGRHG